MKDPPAKPWPLPWGASVEERTAMLAALRFSSDVGKVLATFSTASGSQNREFLFFMNKYMGLQVKGNFRKSLKFQGRF